MTTHTMESMRHERDRAKVVGRLHEVADLRHDIVAPASALRILQDQSGGITLPEPIITSDGVSSAVPVELTRTAYRQTAERLGIPIKYLDQVVQDGQGNLASLNFNMRAREVGSTTLFRLLKLPEGWRLRGVLSSTYQAIDNLDMLTAVANGMQDADMGLGDAEVECDWTDDRFRLRVTVPQVQILIPDLLDGYRSPFLKDGEAPPVLWAGFEASNSETGNGAASLAPRAVVQICRNGMTRNLDIVRAVHLGGRLDEGTVTWSIDTRRKAVALIQSKVTDAVKQFCSEGYLQGLANEMRAAKGLEVTNVNATFDKVKVDLGFTEAEIATAMTMFMRGGDTTVLGVGQAITATAQTVEDGDRQTELENAFWAIVSKPAAFAPA